MYVTSPFLAADLSFHCISNDNSALALWTVTSLSPSHVAHVSDLGDPKPRLNLLLNMLRYALADVGVMSLASHHFTYSCCMLLMVNIGLRYNLFGLLFLL